VRSVNADSCRASAVMAVGWVARRLVDARHHTTTRCSVGQPRNQENVATPYTKRIGAAPGSKPFGPAEAQRRAGPNRPSRMKPYLPALALALVCAASPARGQSATADVYRDIGNTLMRRGRPADAAKSYEDALRIRPDFHEARRGLGLAFMNLSRHKDAEREFRRIVTSRPRDATAHYDLGCALSARGRHEEALAAYREALRLQPGHSQARLAVVSTLTDLGRPGEAIAALSETPRTGEPPSVTLARRARAAHGTARHAEAVLLWTQALESDPAYFDTRDAERVLWNESISALTAGKPVTAVGAP
jgi:tetratricopeptide (TPR) repeat protein